MSDRSVLQNPAFRRLLAARFLLTLAVQVQSLAVAWQVFSLTGKPLDLGMVGLAHFVPMAGLSLLAGQVADRRNPTIVLACAEGALWLSALALAALAWVGTSTGPIYAIIVAIGAARAFSGPANTALLPQIVAAEDLPAAITWGSGSWQVGMVAGPALGGLLYTAFGGPTGVYLFAVGLLTVALGPLLSLPARTVAAESKAATWSTVFEGIRYVFSDRILLGAISLDLFAVLLGGAVALLPIYAEEILKTGPWGLGLLRAAPGVGAACMAVWLGRNPIRHHAGRILFGSVAMFGLFTIAFGRSNHFWLSLLFLLGLGASDMVSVVVRHTLLQLHVPPEMRGRVGAVSQVFIGASNELGEFESGLTADRLQTRPAVVLGGVGTLAVVALWSVFFPQLRNIDRLEDRPQGR